MQIGAFAMFDALGFKGIWERASPQALLKQMGMIRDAVVLTSQRSTGRWGQLATLGALTNPPVMTSLFLSDTIIISAHVAPFADQTVVTDVELEAAMVSFVVHSTAFALAASSMNENDAVPLNYRGVITWGEFLIHDQFIIGPAVDEAALLHTAADAAVVELTPVQLSAFFEHEARPSLRTSWPIVC